MNKQPNYHRAFAIFVCFILTILVIGLAVDQKEMRDMRMNESTLQARIAELETENANLQTEIDALTERAETAESSLAELQEGSQASYAPSYYVAEQYMLERYGSWENARDFWNENGWW